MGSYFDRDPLAKEGRMSQTSTDFTGIISPKSAPRKAKVLGHHPLAGKQVMMGGPST